MKKTNHQRWKQLFTCGGHVNQVPEITDGQVKISAVIIFTEMPTQHCHLLLLGDEENFVFWIL